MPVAECKRHRLAFWVPASTRDLQPYSSRQKPGNASKYIGTMLSATIVCGAGAAFAQGVPCYTAMQCAQIRQQAEQQQAVQRAAQEAASAALVQHQREQAKAAAQARVQAEAQARENAAAAARQAAIDQAALVEQQRRQQQEQAEADVRTRAAELQARSDALEQQRREEQYQAEAAVRARAAEAQARSDAEEQQLQQVQQRADAETRARAAKLLAAQEIENRAAAQLAAENSPDNRCHDQKTAGQLLDYFNGLQAAGDVNSRAVDIDHLTTLKFDSAHSVLSCHGYFVLMDGRHATGTLSTRLNVAGNILTTFHADTD